MWSHISITAQKMISVPPVSCSANILLNNGKELHSSAKNILDVINFFFACLLFILWKFARWPFYKNNKHQKAVVYNDCNTAGLGLEFWG